MIQDGSRWSVGSWVLNQPFRIQEVAKKVQMNHVKIFLTVDSMWYVRKVIPSWDWGENDDPLSKKNWRKINTCQLLRINFYTPKNVKCMNNSTTAHTHAGLTKISHIFSSFHVTCDLTVNISLRQQLLGIATQQARYRVSTISVLKFNVRHVQ